MRWQHTVEATEPDLSGISNHSHIFLYLFSGEAGKFKYKFVTDIPIFT